jgi:hypothetical protein
MILTGHSLVNQRLHMTKIAKTNGQSHLQPLRKRDPNRPSARKRIFDTASESPGGRHSDITAAEQRGEGWSQF